MHKTLVSGFDFGKYILFKILLTTYEYLENVCTKTAFKKCLSVMLDMLSFFTMYSEQCKYQFCI